MSRVVAIFIALIAALFAAIPPGPAVAATTPAILTYSYNGHHPAELSAGREVVSGVAGRPCSISKADEGRVTSNCYLGSHVSHCCERNGHVAKVAFPLATGMGYIPKLTSADTTVPRWKRAPEALSRGARSALERDDIVR